MGLFVLFFVSSVLITFTCSLLEAVILSTSPAYIAVKVKQGKPSGRILDGLKKKINRPLIGILTINTTAVTLGSIGVSVQALKLWGNQSLALVSGIMTATILVVSEIIPKALGAAHWKRLAPFSAYIMQILVMVTFPILIILEQVLLFVGGKKQKLVSRAELIESAEIGASEGSLKRHETVVIRNLLMLEKLLVSDIMTSRAEMTVFPADITVDKLMSDHMPFRFTRVPVYSGNIDNIIGVIHRFRLMDATAKGQEQAYIKDLMSPIEKVDESISVAHVLDLFILKNRHLFVVTNKKNQVVGLVTLEDAIEALLGVDIVDEFESVGDMRKYAAEMLKKRHGQLKQGAD